MAESIWDFRRLLSWWNTCALALCFVVVWFLLQRTDLALPLSTGSGSPSDASLSDSDFISPACESLLHIIDAASERPPLSKSAFCPLVRAFYGVALGQRSSPASFGDNVFVGKCSLRNLVLDVPQQLNISVIVELFSCLSDVDRQRALYDAITSPSTQLHLPQLDYALDHYAADRWIYVTSSVPGM